MSGPADATGPVDEIGIVWFRRDLRLVDNPAWAAATAEREFVVPLYVIDPRQVARVGPYRRRFLYASLQALDYDLAEHHGGRLLVRFGDPTELVPEAVEVLRAGALYLNGDVSPAARRRDAAVRSSVEVPVIEHWGTLVHEPGSVLGADGGVPRVFSPFHRLWSVTPARRWPEGGSAVLYDDPGEPIPRLDLPSPVPEGEGEAAAALEGLLARLGDYHETRDRLDGAGGSRLSPYLHLGVISPRRVLAAVEAAAAGDAREGAQAFARQLAWRDWYAHLLAEHPRLVSEAADPTADAVAWRDDRRALSAWKGGFTGYPAVDAAMRQLRETGQLSNRARLVAASFLTKHLLVDWRVGEAHFRNLLVDGDVAQNVGNWQWVSGAGHDAAPYVRILDPVAQGREHDPDGTWVRRWVPELAALDTAVLHAPWEAGPLDLAAAGIELGRDYPERIVDHAEARERALAAWAEASGQSAAEDTGGEDGGRDPVRTPAPPAPPPSPSDD